MTSLHKPLLVEWRVGVGEEESDRERERGPVEMSRRKHVRVVECVVLKGGGGGGGVGGLGVRLLSMLIRCENFARNEASEGFTVRTLCVCVGGSVAREG